MIPVREDSEVVIIYPDGFPLRENHEVIDCYNFWRSMHLNDIQCYDVLSHSTYYILYLTVKNETCLETTRRSTAPILAKMSSPWVISCKPPLHLGVSENSVPRKTQWFSWSLSLWKIAISLGILTQHFQTNPPGCWLRIPPGCWLLMLFIIPCKAGKPPMKKTHAHQECCNLHRLQWPSPYRLVT